MRDRFDVLIEEPAKTVLREMTMEEAAHLVAGLRELEYDPWVESLKDGETGSMAVVILKRKGYDVRRLRVKDVTGWRTFYYVDTSKRKVLVKEIIPRADDTYELSAPHVRRLISNYRRYFCAEVEPR